MTRRRFTFTILGGLVSLVAVLTWIATFEPHGGVELSGYLFPAWSWLAGVLFTGRSVPVPVWYGGALLHWVLLGALVDFLRGLRWRHAQRRLSAQLAAGARERRGGARG